MRTTWTTIETRGQPGSRQVGSRRSNLPGIRSYIADPPRPRTPPLEETAVVSSQLLRIRSYIADPPLLPLPLSNTRRFTASLHRTPRPRPDRPLSQPTHPLTRFDVQHHLLLAISVPAHSSSPDVDRSPPDVQLLPISLRATRLSPRSSSLATMVRPHRRRDPEICIRSEDVSSIRPRRHPRLDTPSPLALHWSSSR